MSTPTTTVIFDGVCNLCNSTVDFLITHEKGGTMRFGQFQQEHVAEMLRSHHVIDAPETVYVLTPQGILLKESTAIIYLGTLLGGWWKFLATIARVVPSPIRDVIYRLVARNRYRWFGKKESCRLPTPEERSRFI